MEYSHIEISDKQAIEFAQKYYGKNGTVKKLPGEVDFNFYLKDEKENEFTLKISRPDTDQQAIDFQAKIINHLAASKIPLGLPEVVLTTDGKEYIELENNRFLRLQRWIPGRMLSEVNPRSQQLLKSWGNTCGLLSLHLKNFDHKAAHRSYKWNPSEVLASKKYRPYIDGISELEIADYFWCLFEASAQPYLSGLRKSVNYNDAHEHNLLADFDLKSPAITGVIDFGDALYTETINELAIACAYACMYLPDPLQAAANVVQGYHQIFPIEENEVKVLFPLIAARLLLTVTNSAWNKHNEPDNKYLLVSENPAWDLLKRFKWINPNFAHYTFRNACGLEPCPSNQAFQSWAKSVQLAPIFNYRNHNGSSKIIAPLDLSVGSLELGNNSNFENFHRFEKKINEILNEKNAEIGLGGYGETRPFYTADAYKVEGNNGAQWRTVHLGMDVWLGAGTSIYAPLDGIIFSIKNNAGDCDYGPTIILEHRINEELIFYSLYGHLNLESLDGKEIGLFIKKGEKIAEVGAPPINGNWPPHLHFQLMLDMLGNEGDFPGVSYPHEAETWKSISPDPFLFFPKIKLNEYHDQTTEIISVRLKSLGRSLSISYNEPLHIVRGYKQYLYDTTGRRFLDTVNNVPHVGHQHPRVVRAAQRQMGILNTNTRYLHENITQFAKELLATFPPELSVVYFVNSGSEANELALRMVEAFTGDKNMIAMEIGYHGNTGRCVEISSYKFDGKGGKGAPPHTHIVPIPDIFRGIHKNEKNAGKKYAAHVGKTIEQLKSKGKNIGGFICESIISCGGQIVLPENYLKEAYQYVRAAGGLCIADEVQVGFGRVGEKFWGFELQSVVPDIVTLGKPIGNGHPLAAVVTTVEVADAFANGMEYFNTFGGNPVSCAIGREVLKIIQEEGLQQQALEVGTYLKNKLIELKEKFSIIGDVRGHGLFLGFELIKNMDTLAPATEEAFYLANRMRQRGVLMSTDGPFNNVIKIKPPMCFDKSNADFLMDNLEVVMGEDFLIGFNK